MRIELRSKTRACFSLPWARECELSRMSCLGSTDAVASKCDKCDAQTASTPMQITKWGIGAVPTYGAWPPVEGRAWIELGRPSG